METKNQTTPNEQNVEVKPNEAQGNEPQAKNEPNAKTEPQGDAKQTPDTKPSDKPQGDKKKTAEEQLAEALAKVQMLEKKLDKTKESEEAFRKKYNETLTESQRAAMEKAEADAADKEELEQLRAEKAINALEKSYLKLGYPEAKAEEIARAQHNGELDTVFRIHAEVDAERKKTWEEEFLRNRPEMFTGAGNGDNEDVFEKAFRSV